MAKQLNVNMQFTADGKQAKHEIEALQMSLKKLVTMSNIKPAQGMTDEIRKATNATAELSAHLQKATNIKTGNLDFSKLSQSLKASGKSLDHYGEQLRRLGPDGQQAFMQLTQAIVQSEVPLRRTNALVKEFATTLANTARWQLSSSVLHGFMGALQSAYGYAQDLNESLNNIRIVTGASVDEMADFAKEANKAAKSLSATTTQYTKASLIYFQQGLSEADVKKRADVTVKLAKVSRQSAEDVSDQMTAIWNNFYDGSKSLEHYADVLTALGAATASSTEEIAGGLEKFAAIADTIGLSYDYAAAALATLTSNTRESEEVVGTALKTIFARIQGLNLGETLDDGTTVNKYSEALARVGINIKDTNGNLKDMDILLDEMGEKWNQLSRDQQTALAQTVAGTRQYNQLMALMANWNNGDSDSFQANLATAKSANGALQEQADIYAESWEAAADRVTAAAEEIYDKLINDEFFIDLLNNIEKIISFVDRLIDNLGGLKGVLTAVGAIVTRVFSEQLSQGLTNVAYNIQMMTKTGRQKVLDERTDYIKKAADTMAKAAETGEAGKAEGIAAELYENQLNRQAELMDNADKMSEIEKATVQSLMDQLKLRNELAIKSAEELQQIKDRQSEAASLLFQRGAEKAEKNETGYYSSELMSDEMTKMKAGLDGQRKLKELFAQKQKASNEDIIKIFEEVNTSSNGKGWNLFTADDKKQLEEVLKNTTTDSSDIVKGLLGNINSRIQKHAGEIIGASEEEIQNYVKSVDDATRAEAALHDRRVAAEQTNKNLEKTIKESTGAQKGWADMLVTSANFALSAASAINMLQGAFDTLADPDVSGWEKFTTILTTLGMLIPTLISLWTSFKTLLSQETIAKLANAGATIAQVAAERALNKEKGIGSDITKENTKKTTKDTINKGIDTIKDGAKGIKNNVTGFFKDTSNKFNQGVWDKLDDKTQQLYRDQAMQKYKKQLIPTGDSNIFIDKKTGNQVSMASLQAKQNTNIINANAMKAAGTKAFTGMAGGALLIGAGVAVATMAVKAAIAQYNKYSDAAKKASQAAKEAAEAYNATAEAYNKFKSNISDYKAAKDGLKDLVKGTLEYKEALLKANEVAQEMVNSGNLVLGTDYTIDSDGLIQINEEAMQRVQNEKMTNMQNAATTKQLAAINAQQAQTKSDTVDLLRSDIKSTSGFFANVGNIAASTAAGAGSGALIGGGLGMIGGPFAAITAGLGAVVGSIAGLTTGIVAAAKTGSASGREQKAIDAIAEAYASGEVDKQTGKLLENMTDDEYKDYLQRELKIDDMTLVNSLTENRAAIKQLSDQMKANTDATKALNLQLTADALSDNESVQNSDYKDEITKTTSNRADEEQKKILKTLNEEGWGTEDIAQIDKVNAEAKKVWERYAKAAGLEGTVLIDTMGNDKNREFKWRDADGKEHTLDLDSMKKTVAANEAKAALNDYGTEVAAIYNKAGKSGAAILNAVTNNDYGKLTVSQLQKGFSNLNLTDEDAIKLGYGSANDYLAAQEKAQDAAQNSWSKILSSHTSEVEYAMKNIAASTSEGMQNITQGTLKAYGDMLEGLGSTTDIYGFNTALTNIMQANPEDAEKIMQAASGIDWSQGAIALTQFNGQLYDMGVDIEENEALWESFQKAVNSMTFSVLNRDLNTMRNTLATINKIAKGIELGDVISDEDYKKLVAVNGSLKKDFVMTADGYAYVGDGNLKEQASAAALAELEKAKANNERAIAAYNALQRGAFAAEDWEGLATGVDGDAASITMATNLTNDSTILNALGKDASYVNDLITGLQSTDAAAQEESRKRLKELFSDVQALETKYTNGDFQDTKYEEILAFSYANTIEELNAMRGNISKDVYDKRLKVLQEQIADRKEEKALESYEERIQTINDKLSLLSKRKDNAFGAKKVAAIQAEINAINELIAAEQSYNTYLQARYNMEQAELQSKGVQFNANGNITNYNALINKYGADDPFWEELDNYLNLMSKYNASKSSLLDAEIQKSAALLEKSTYQMQFNLEVDSRDIDYLNDKLERLKDDIYGIAEAFSYLIGEVSSNGSLDTSNSQLAIYSNQLSDFANAFNNLNIAYNNGAGAMSEKDYQEGLKQTYTEITNTINSLFELDEAAMQYYGDTLKLANEELDKHISKIEKQNKALEHYKNMLGILGKETDYESIGIILEGQASVAKNEYLAANKSYEMYAKEAEKWKNKIKTLYNADGTLMAGKEKELEVYEKNLEEAENLANEYYDRSVSAAEAWAEKEKAVIENTFAQLNQSLENALTGGTSFDQMNSAFERAQSLQEEYLTTTNQIYETTKMMRTAQQAIDKSTNSIAKQKLANFVKETKSLQDQNKLSKFELDMQQAKYDLLVAEIALEEAQNAKSVVRLQRDAEGNFGYVYTADSSQVNNALQAFDDAQNALYNKGLEATNEYTEKYKSTLSSMYDQLSEAHENYLNGVYESEEEYQAEVEAIKEFHFAKLGDYSRLYSLAIETDSAVAQDAWSIEFRTMVESTEEWKKKVNDYLDEANTTLGTWSDKVVEIQNTTKQPFDDLAGEVEDIVTETQNLIDKLLGKDDEEGLIDALQDEIDKVGTASTAYATYREEVVKTIEELTNLKDTIKSKMSGKLTISWEPEQPAPEEPGGSGDNGNSQGDDFEGPPLPPSSNGSIDVSTTTLPVATSLEDEIRNILTQATGLHLDLAEIVVSDTVEQGIGMKYKRVYMDGQQVGIYNVDAKEFAYNFQPLIGGGYYQDVVSTSFDTGGYTGAWGPEGKMAMLHEKELILDKDDTSNLLMTIDLLDNILSKIDFYAMSQQFGGILSSPNNIAAAASALEQNVKIEASFPNVQDKYEIEEAFNTLINKASQYANRK